MLKEIFDPNKTVRHISMRAMRNEYKAQQKKLDSLAYWSVFGILLFAYILYAVCNG